MLKIFKQTIYVQIEKDAFTLFHVQENKRIHVSSPSPFSNARLAIAEFNLAEEILAKGLLEIYPKSFLRVAPVLVMHQLHQTEGGLCEIEERILRELALSVGAKQVYIWQGSVLSSEQLLNKAYTNKG